MNTVFVLMMVVGGFRTDAGLTSINQEFSSLERCEVARKAMETEVAKERKGGAWGSMKYSGVVLASTCQQK